MQHTRSCLFSAAIIVLLLLILFPVTGAAETCAEWVAKVVSVQGSVQAQIKDQRQWIPVRMNDTFCSGDMIRVQERSRTAVVLTNDTIIRLDQNTTITITGIEKKKTSLLDVINGVAHFISRFPRTLKVSTPFVNGNVEGTEFLVRVYDDHSIITVFEGDVLATNQRGSLSLASGQSAIAHPGQAPLRHVVVRPDDAVLWALYYPPIMYYRLSDFPGDVETDWQAAVRKSILHYRDGDLSGAWTAIADITDEIPDPHFYIYRASILLTVGRVEEAEKDIGQAQNIQRDNSDATALQSIIAVVKNEKEKALGLAEKAVNINPDSATAHIALSYSRQANFDLQEALQSLQEAVRLEPGNSLAWARLAELWLSFKELDKGLEAAKKAEELNPHLARTQTVLGFAYLTQVMTQQALDAFKRAIELDQAAPLPRLGRGLAKIRKGQVKEGRREIEIAASLDPNNSLIRSYLSKSYYEEKRNALAEGQLKMAKELDPRDPTPFLYDAIRKQSVNRPVEALRDMQKSIELNDNRAVYRSKQLLDEDLAARSASLARIYTDLGFQQRALVEGWKSVNTDPGNYSAHRFLADSYAALPRHEIARVSELLQSQMMQPLNITPVQPSLGESDLFILAGAGPGDPSFHEFNPLFNRNKVSLRVSGIGGEHDTEGNELVLSAVHENLSFSVGQFHYATDGFRKNNDLDEDIYNVFVQASLSYRTSIMAEFRSTEKKNGDVTLNFDPDDFLPNKREDVDTKSFRAGLRHVFSPRSEIMATLIYKDSDGTLHDFNKGQDISSTVSELGAPFTIFCPATVLSDLTTDIVRDDDGYMGEVQHQFKAKQVSVISGGGIFSGDIREAVDLNIPVSCPPLPLLTLEPSTVDETYLQHINFYVYTHITYPENMTWTIGASSDFFEGGLIDQTDGDPNPKLGLTWNILPDTTIRAAVFRVLTRTLISSQTLEPTQVAGFNQFFDDVEGSESWRYGIGVDKKFTDTLFGGLEFSNRDIDVPIQSQSGTGTLQVRETDWREQVARLYLYWTPHRWLALSAEYEYERFDRSDFFLFIEESKTHSVPVGINVYHPSGLSTRLKTTYINQDGRFHTQSSRTRFSGSDDFWTVDALISYRLPKRWGLITFGAKNLFDTSFSFQDSDPVRPVMQPERLIFAKFTLAI